MAKAKYTKDKNGYFHTMVWDGTYTETGQKHRIHLRSKKSSADLERMAGDMRRKVEDGKVVHKTNLSFSDYADQWVEAKSVYAKKTQQQYKDIIRYYITPAMSAVSLSSVSKYHLQKMILDNAAHPRTCQLIRRVFLQIVNAAIEDHYVPESILRPLQSVEMPRLIRRERRTLTDAEKKAVFAADFTPMQRCFVFLLFFCGLRRGEALGVMVSDCDFASQSIRIRRSVEMVVNASAIKVPKTANGFRTVPMTPQLRYFLTDYIPTLKTGYLIHSKNGGIMTQSSFRRMWEQIVKKMDVSVGGTKEHPVIMGLTPHIFRHNLCTELCYQVPTISTKHIARIMGHNESMVIRIYSHILEEKEDAPAAFDRIFSGFSG